MPDLRKHKENLLMPSKGTRQIPEASKTIHFNVLNRNKKTRKLLKHLRVILFKLCKYLNIFRKIRGAFKKQAKNPHTVPQLVLKRDTYY